MKVFIFLIAGSFILPVYGQTIILGNLPKTVPQGKKWILSANKEILIEVSDGTLNSGTLCNANIMSNPRILTGIVEGDYGTPKEVYGILFKELVKAAYANSYTYSIIPISIIDSKFSLYELQHKDLKEVGSRQIVFYPGQKLYVNQCLQSIQLTESDLTAKELADIKKKEAEVRSFKQKEDEEQRQQEIRNKIKDEQEKRNKTLNASGYFYSTELSNEKELKLSVQAGALEIFYQYIQEFSKQNPVSYNDKMDYYNRRERNSSGKDDDNYMFDFSLYFDKTGNLNKISNNRAGERSADLDLDTNWFEKLKPFISLNKAGIIKLDGKEHLLDSYYLTFFSFFYEQVAESEIKISVNKKGVITTITNYSKLPDAQALAMLRKSDKISSLGKGKYSVKITTDLLKLVFSHVQNYGMPETIRTGKETNTIKSIEKL